MALKYLKSDNSNALCPLNGFNKCRKSDCMAWRDSNVEGLSGFCGLAGIPICLLDK